MTFVIDIAFIKTAQPHTANHKKNITRDNYFISCRSRYADRIFRATFVDRTAIQPGDRHLFILNNDWGIFNVHKVSPNSVSYDEFNTRVGPRSRTRRCFDSSQWWFKLEETQQDDLSLDIQPEQEAEPEPEPEPEQEAEQEPVRRTPVPTPRHRPQNRIGPDIYGVVWKEFLSQTHNSYYWGNGTDVTWQLPLGWTPPLNSIYN